MAAIEDFVVPRGILERYATSGPRYTSYPTVPEWSADFGAAEARQLYQANNRKNLDGLNSTQECWARRPLSLYCHIPYCHSLCYYCGCNVKISRNKAVSGPYLAKLEQEMDLVAPSLNPERRVAQMHWGGGTPTYLTPEQIQQLVAAIRARFRFEPRAEISIEVDPRVTTREHVLALRECGFNRISMGIQDFNQQVQQAVNRRQPFEQTAQLIEWARQAGFLSVNIDLMYGLPFQTGVTFAETLELVRQLTPDRMALFNYAHVPWMKPGQKLIKEDTLPDAEAKLSIFELAIRTFLGWGYRYIGMDHFAKPGDELSVAQQKRTLQRNFMGYTTHAGTDLYGFGVSSISEIDGHFMQSHHQLPEYESRIAAGQLATMRGLVLSADDHLRKEIISRLSCHGYLDFAQIEALFLVNFADYFREELAACRPLAGDGLIEMEAGAIRVLPRGQILIRNVCMIWDAYLKNKGAQRQFSRTV